MKTKIIECTNGPRNWGKFLIGQFDEVEWSRRSVISGMKMPLLREVGWSPDTDYRLVLDLQTGEGAVFRIGGVASFDLEKHRIWVCPLFEPFLIWLYMQPRPLDLDALPEHIDIPEAMFAYHGYRRPGPSAE